MLGAEGKGYGVLERISGYALLALAAESVGAMDVAKQHTLEYLQTRKQFGVAIGTFQALQHRMADVLLEIEQARSAVINAADAIDNAEGVAQRKGAVGRQVHRGLCGHQGGAREHSAARRYRHDLGAAAGALRQASGHDRSPVW